MTSWYKLSACNITNHHNLNSFPLFLKTQLLNSTDRPFGVHKLKDINHTLNQTSLSYEKVPDIQSKHAEFKPINKPLSIIDLPGDHLPINSHILGCSILAILIAAHEFGVLQIILPMGHAGLESKELRDWVETDRGHNQHLEGNQQKNAHHQSPWTMLILNPAQQRWDH